MIGFETVGNATLIVHDDQPLLAADPWISSDAYFGSWGHSHEIPKEQVDHVQRCRFVYFSHAHPDHLNPGSLANLTDKQILLADHVGGRIAADLKSLGCNVRVLPDRSWVKLSDRIRVLSIADPNQDSVLLVDVDGYLVIDLNDARHQSWASLVKRISRLFRCSILMKLSAFHGDMFNLYTEEGTRVLDPDERKQSVGRRLARYADLYDAQYVVPFSSFHSFQREDSVWANQYVTPLSAYGEGFDSSGAEILPPFIKFDCETGEVCPINPRPNEIVVYPSSAFGDNWADPLEADDRKALELYFSPKERLKDRFGFLTFRVGGRDTTLDINKANPRCGLTFEVPRNSLMTAVKNQTFDDLLLGNFMKTTLHGAARLSPHFTRVVAKYADNGRAQSREEVDRYLKEYFRRAPVEMVLNLIEEQATNSVRKLVRNESWLYRRLETSYFYVKRHL